jgi:hypothetical protein
MADEYSLDEQLRQVHQAQDHFDEEGDPNRAMMATTLEGLILQAKEGNGGRHEAILGDLTVGFAYHPEYAEDPVTSDEAPLDQQR